MQLFFLGVAILIQAECQRLRYRPRNGPLMQRGSAMLFLYLTPWVVFRVCMASPLPEVFPVLQKSLNRPRRQLGLSLRFIVTPLASSKARMRSAVMNNARQKMAGVEKWIASQKRTTTIASIQGAGASRNAVCSLPAVKP